MLKALPGAQPAPGWDVPAWRVGSLLVVEPGMGADLAAAVLPGLDAQGVSALWLYGWCGGLSPELDAGDMALADATVWHDAREAPIRHPPPDALQAQVRRLAEKLGLRLVVGAVLTSDRVLASVADKQAGAAAGAVAVEMEAGPLARWAVERDVPFVHLRVVIDPAGSALPVIHSPADSHRRAPAYALVWHMLTHVRQWPAFWRLVRQARTAQKAMTQVIAALTGPDGPLSV